ncbi:Histidine kinase 5 [Rhynchospora pubera]|uniref:histidine kinase n=1 Tax=Rhynchospora pubera TaxID=906938 RepID=A0AAV8CVF6_9POAL|nr:Histidine kinase 5 [Rhynchospora pubera]
MGEDLDFCDEEPLASMWPPDIEDKSNKQFNIEKPSLTEDNFLKEFKSKTEKHKLDFMRLAELTDYSDIGSHQLTNLVKQYKFRRANAARLLQDELDTLSKQRQEIEQRGLDILQEHRFVERNHISVLEEESYDIWGTADRDRANKSMLSYKNEIDVGVHVTGEDGTVGYWKERAVRLHRLLDESLKRESILVRKLQESVKMEEQNLPVEELSHILKRADNFLHFILQNAPVVIAHQDKDLRYRFIYNHFPSLGEEDVIGKTDEEILSVSEGVKEFQDFKREVLENGRAAKREITYEHPLFGKKTFLTFVEPVFNKKREIIGINYMGFEVTDQVVKREKLAKYREEMAVQKAKETELFKTIHVTEETMRAKQMLATMSHEIRSPLTGVVSMAEILANTNLDVEQRQLLDVMLSSGDLVMQLINDILDLSKVESGVMQLEEAKFRPREVVRHVLQTAAASLKKDLILEGHVSDDIPLEVMGDVLRIRQILTNLISNAVKFTHNGKVGINLRVVPEPNTCQNPATQRCSSETSCSSKTGNETKTGEEIVWLQYEVYDTGIGIPEKAIPTLFKRYMQASADHARKYGGTGLGLAICKQLVELMEGTITVDSKENVGSTFRFVLPCKVPPLEQDLSDDPDEDPTMSRSSHIPNPMEGFFLFKPKTVQKPKPPGNSQLKQTASTELAMEDGKGRPLHQSSVQVLLVEDNKVNIMVAKSMVEQLGHSVCVVNNGLEAIRAVQQTRFDLILMDVHMPVMDGLQATRLIRSFEENGYWDASVGPTCHTSPASSFVSHDCHEDTRKRKRTPIIAMTANAFGESASECLDSGMDSYISKPVTFQNLKEVLQNFFASNS